MLIKAHPDFPDYQVQEDGRVFRVRANDGRAALGEIFGRVLRSGYRQFKLVDASGSQRLIRANRLVAETFHGAAPTSLHHAAHINGERLNNHADNIRWATAKENTADKIRHGTLPRGSRVGTARLTESAVAQIRGAYTGSRGEKARFARLFGVGQTTINRIVNGEGWSHVDRR